MDKRIKDILQKDNELNYKEKSWYTPIETDDDALEYLLEGGEEVAQIDEDERRWWVDFTVIKKFKTGDNEYQYIGYRDAYTTGDPSPTDLGWEFDKDSIKLYEMTEEEKTIKVKRYNPIEL